MSFKDSKARPRTPKARKISWDGLRTYVEKKVPATVKLLYGKDGGEQRPNEIGNLIGQPTVLAIARIGRDPPDKLMPEPPDSFAGTREHQTREITDLKLTQVWIPAGQFTLGSPSDEKSRSDDEDPLEVTVRWLLAGQKRGDANAMGRV